MHGVSTINGCNLYCKTDRRENPFVAPSKISYNKVRSGAAKDWNDSGGQRPALIQVKSNEIKSKKNTVLIS